MIKKKYFVFGFAILLVVSIFLVACNKTTQTTVTTTTTVSSATDGKSLVETKCTACHNAQKVYSEKANLNKWGKIVDEMITKGAVVNSEERTKIIDYLVSLNK